MFVAIYILCYTGVQAGATAYLLLLELGLNQVVLPRMVDGTSDAIPLPDVGFPFWSTSRSTVYVSYPVLSQ